MRSAARLPVAALVSIAVLLTPLAAVAGSGTQSQFVADTNSARASHGLPRYAVAGDLTAVAQRWAAHMAAHHQLAHNPSFTRQVCCWSQIGENVGVGRNVSSIQQAFMASASHRANILSRSYTQVGIGTAWDSNHRLYVDELFRRPMHTAPRTVRATRTAPVSARTHPRVVLRASRSAVRRPRATPPARVPSAAQVLLGRLAAARVLAAGGYADPVAGAVVYLQVIQRLDGSQR